MAYQDILARQEASFENIKQICTNYKKDSTSRKNLEYILTRLGAIDSHWQEFQVNHQKLLEIADPEIPYFKDGVYNKLRGIYEETKQNMLQLKLSLESKSSELSEPSGSKETYQHKKMEQTTEESDNLIQDLLRKQDCNFKAFERVCQKINVANMNDKWEFEESLNILKSKWERIDKVNWDLDYALQSPNLEYENTYLEMEMKYDILRKQINQKMWDNAHYEKSAPTLQLPEFTGNYSTWTSFKDLFVETIHLNPLIPKARKMQHLKSKLSGEAERLVRHLKTSADNYDSCWDILQHRYDNKRLMFTSYMSTLYNLPVLQQANASNVKKLHDVTLECLNGLNNIGINTHTWDPIIVYLLCQKLDSETYNDYISKLKSPRDPPELEEFILFLESKFIGFEGMRGNQQQKQNQQPNINLKKNNNPNNKSLNFNKSVNPPRTFYTTAKNCPTCKTDHVLMQCDKFLSLPIDARNALVAKMKLCKNCLYSHGEKKCTSFKTCRVCQKPHHTLLHDNKEATGPRDYTDKQVSSNTQSGSKHLNSVTNEDKEVLLTTMLLKVKNVEGEYVTMRALLDQGSQVSLLTENAAQLLRIPRQKLSAVVSGVGTLSGSCKSSVRLECKSIHSNFTFNVETLVIRKLVTNLPSQSFEIKDWEYLENLKLADPTFNVAAPIDMLLGADIYSELILDGIIKGNKNYPIAQQTKAGWILCGSVKTFNCFVTLNELQEITRFWESEDITDSEPQTNEDIICEKIYVDTTERRQDGKYVVRMPMMSNFEEKLGQTRPQALAQFLQLERKMEKNKTFGAQYKNFMSEYLTMGHMTPVTSSTQEHVKSYLPHHGVLREESTTTKLRVVFNASMPSSSKYSLNDLMYTGPNLQKDMLTLLIHWRTHRYVFTADVEKMYRNMFIHQDQQGLQTILWRPTPREPMQEMRLCTVSYGTKAAPYLAMRTLQQLAQDEAHLYPAASEVLGKWFYMDDLVHGKDRLDSAKKLIADLIALMNKGGFNLRKWASNEPLILEDLKEDQKCIKNEFCFKTDQNHETKTLGIAWNSKSDTFTFSWNVANTTKQTTKRMLLSDVSKLYDPLGWLAPITIKAKILFQNLWVQKIQWDEKLPEQISKEWEKLRNDLPNINKIFLRRWLSCPENKIEIHGFSDASEKAYACVVYSRTRNESGEYVITLIAAKTKVAPLKKKLSMPRIELCGSLLLAKLIQKIKSTITEKQLDIYCWSDSQVVLAWLQGNANRWERYVANRAQQVTSDVPADRWFYVKSEDNPADCATRGLYPSQLVSFELWWKGPQWLKTLNTTEIDKTTKQIFTTEIETQAINRRCMATKSADEDELIHITLHKYSSLSRVIRVISWVLRFIANLRNKQNRKKNILSKQEMDSALEMIVKRVQEKYFSEEIDQLRRNGAVTKKSNLLKLTPFLDDNGIMRVKGRLQNSQLPENTKHPIIIPNDGPFTKLLIADGHKKTLHGGARLTLAYLRQQYWVIGGSRTVKKQLRLCVKCHRFQPHKSEQIMADLPRERVTPSRPFTNTGIDFTGHVDVKINKGKGVKTCKGYIAIFICMVTKAVHLELVSDLSTPTFLAALRRMCARRGTPKHIFSDNGTNFQGAAKQLHEEFQRQETFSSLEFREEIAQSAIEWHFNAPIWPTAGGLWEAAVKSMKFHLKRVLGEQKLTFEQFTTLLAAIESCMNSRPLLPLSEDVDDLEYLTPGHFLIGGPLLTLPHEDNDDFIKYDLRNRWRLVCQMNQHIWKKWSSEYLTQLQTRSKWQLPTKNIEKGNLVLIKDNNLPPGKWLVGRVLETYPGADGNVRVVTLKTKGGELKRPITKLVAFPEQETSEQNIAETQEKQNENKERKRQTRSRGVKQNLLSLFTIALVMCFGSGINASNANYKITPMKTDNPIYYDEIGNLQLIHDDWNLVVYYNLTAYFEAQRNINMYVTHIERICKRMVHEPCDSIINQLRHKIRHLSDNDALMLSEPLHRRKRGYFDGVGNLERTLFGTLDEEFAKKYEKDIEILKNNDKHLLNLLRNHTLIIEAENNIIKNSENYALHRFKSMQAYLQRIHDDMSTMETRLQRLVTMSDVNTASLTASLILSDLYRIQDMLLRTMSDFNNGHLDISLLPVSQLVEKLDFIAGRLPRGLSLPVKNVYENIRQIYDLLYINYRLTKRYLLVEINIPLISDDEYTVYRIIPLNFQHNNQLKRIRPRSHYIAVNLLKNTYLDLEQEDIKSCKKNQPSNYICIAPQPVYNMHAKNAPCEAKLFGQQNSLSCGIDEVECTDDWVKLNKYIWLFNCCEKRMIRIICNGKISSETIFGIGFITLGPGCMIQREEATIFAINQFRSQTNIQPDVEDSMNVTTINNMISINWKSARHNITAIEETPSNAEIARLQKQITRQKEQEVLPEPVTTLSSHDVYHYAITSALVAGAFAAIIYVVCKRLRCCRCQQRPQPSTSNDVEVIYAEVKKKTEMPNEEPSSTYQASTQGRKPFQLD